MRGIASQWKTIAWIGVIVACGALLSCDTEPTLQEITVAADRSDRDDGDRDGRDSDRDGDDSGRDGEDPPEDEPPADDEPPPPPEDDPPGNCSVVVQAPSDPQPVVDAASPGDVICLQGTFTQGQSSNFQEGDFLVTINTPGITLRGGTVAGQGENLNVAVSADNVTVEQMVISRGMILVGWYFDQVSGVVVQDNDVCCAVYPAGNSGLIRVHGSQSSGNNPFDITIRNNYLHDAAGIGETWDTDGDTEHHACITVQNADGPVTIEGVTTQRCPSAVYFKYAHQGVITLDSNTFRDHQVFGHDRAPENTVCSGNTLINVGFSGPSDSFANACG